MRSSYEQIASLLHSIVLTEPWYSESLCPLSTITSCIGKLYSNRFAVTTVDLAAPLGHSFTQETAIALYPLLSLANHRCNPNATVVFDGLKASLRAIAPIHKGDEITVIPQQTKREIQISYVDSARPSYLRNRYDFWNSINRGFFARDIALRARVRCVETCSEISD